MLCFRGLPCPNLGVGAHNFHGRKEFAVVQSMDNVVELLIRLVQAIAQESKDI
jgi:tripeptide aminopeptidase